MLTCITFICGSLMFSYWLGKWARCDLRRIGDGNPGAYNLWQAAGYRWGIAGVALDFLKGYVPVYFIVEWGLAEGGAIVPIASAPIAGHAFSPFMKGKGGKAIAVTFGVWSALTRFELSLVYAIVLAVLLVVFRMLQRGGSSPETDGLMTVTGLLPVGIYLALCGQPASYLWIWLINFAVVAFANRRELAAVLHRFLPGEVQEAPRNKDA